MDLFILKKTGMINWLVVEESVMIRASKIIVTLLTHQLLWVKIGEYRWYYVSFKKNLALPWKFSSYAPVDSDKIETQLGI